MFQRRRSSALLVSLVLFAAACDWGMSGFGPARTGFSARENAITVANVATLTEAWNSGPGTLSTGPVVGSGKVFVNSAPPSGSDVTSLNAYDVDASPACRGSVTAVCAATWSHPFATSNFIRSPFVVSAPSVDAGTVIVGATSLSSSGVYAITSFIDAATGGDRYAVFGGGGNGGSPAVDGDVMAASITNIAKPIPSPVWFDTMGVFDTRSHARRFLAAIGPGSAGVPTFARFSSPSISDEVVYALTQNTLFAYDLGGVTNCGNFYFLTGPICLPLWSAPMAHPGGYDAMPAVANGLVYVPELDGHVEVFNAAGCGAVTCASVWSAVAGSVHLSPVAVTESTLFAGSDDGRLYAFAAGGCGATTCQPTWRADFGAPAHTPSVAGSLVFIGSDSGALSAFNAAGCGGATCTPLWSTAVGAPIRTAPAISNGHVFITDASGTLHAYQRR